ncbi:phosphatase PAP2 family protein [Kribbella sp. NPDC056951]|uniref:phosphatase PAP2 family protein n=1 Tax=Kribbella sp. NPDC056951 TaxID=3345978 RepID=UPI00362E9626
MEPWSRSRLILVGAGSLVAVVAAGYLLRTTIPPADHWLVTHAYAAPGSTPAAVATTVSGIGTLIAVVALLVVAALTWRRRGTREGLLPLAVVPVCLSLLALQGLLNREGPPQQPEAGTYPSGHVTVVTTAVAVTLLIGTTWRRRIAALGSTAILLVSASRIALAEHWLLDVAGGIAGVAGVALLSYAVLHRPRPQTVRR